MFLYHEHCAELCPTVARAFPPVLLWRVVGLTPSRLLRSTESAPMNFGLYSALNHFSQASTVVDAACSAAVMAVSSAIAAAELGQGKRQPA